MPNTFSGRVLSWFDTHGRKDLPWQQYDTPYPIWLAEIMLQQTQVKTVIPYFQTFMERFPTVFDLASAPEDEVLHLWSGLGYYARARNLHRAAGQIVEAYQGVFPSDQQGLESLRGVGRSTAAAIRAQAFGQKAAILDGNVKRVIARFYGIEGWPGKRAVEDSMWALTEALLPEKRLRDYTQALMDMGALLCTRRSPMCEACPVQSDCVAHQTGRTDQLPTRKPKAAVPIKETLFLIVVNAQGDVLLEKRPPTGIWGGLWSFPESSTADLDDVLQRLSLPIETGQAPIKLEAGEHVFSHYRLRYQPLLFSAVDTEMSSKEVSEGGQRIWYSGERPQALGLAAPVSRLLQQLQAR